MTVLLWWDKRDICIGTRADVTVLLWWGKRDICIRTRADVTVLLWCGKRDICIRTRANVTVLLWWGKRDICMLMNIHDAPAESNFCNGAGRATKLQIVMDYNRHMGYVNKRNKMANSYSIGQRTNKWMKKLCFQLLDLAILNSYILHSSCGGKKISHKVLTYPREEYVGTR